MLILTRKVNERIVIGDDIEVSVVEIRGDQVKLGISAPQNVKVHRREVFDQIQAENRAAALSASPDLTGLAGLFSSNEGVPSPGTTETAAPNHAAGSGASVPPDSNELPDSSTSSDPPATSDSSTSSDPPATSDSAT